MSRRREVLALYKTLLFMGREYPHPEGFSFFRTRLKAAFDAKKNLTDDADINRAIALGNHVVKEIEALYYLKKYRTLKRNYDPHWQ